VGRIAHVFKDTIRQPFEVILIDDGSENPKTWQIMQELAQMHPYVSSIKFTRNFGKPNALICGFEHAAGEYLITMDDDLQHAPEDIPLLIAKQEHDLVIGSYPRSYANPLVQLSSWIKNWCDSAITRKPLHIRMSPFRLMHSFIAKSVVQIKTPYPFVAALLFFVTRDIVMVEVTHHPRPYGTSNYSFMRRVSQFLRLLINNSSILLRLVAYLGLAMSVISPLVGLYLILRKMIWGLGVPGWTSLMIVLLITSGLMLASIGIIGEYLIRIIRGVENRPAYIIRDQIMHVEADK
jgi:dolichol-phosphate mannosyltransferase/undecaprenyl-phosphate 4-deoxy-4-formamido-L-arabinose transferase